MEKKDHVINLPPPSKPLPSSDKSATTIATVVAFYFVVSISIVFLNKYIMKGFGDYKFDYPLAMTWFQLVFAMGCIFGSFKMNKTIPFFSFLPDFEWKWETARNVLSLTFVYVGMLVFNNLCLKYVDVSFYQVARSLSIVFSIIFTYFLMGQATAPKALIACGVVIIGYILGSIGEFGIASIEFSWIGLFFGLLSSAFVALNSIYVKQKLQFVNKNHWLLLIYNTGQSIFVLFPLIIISGEWSEVKEVIFDYDLKFWVVMCITALLGYLINIAIYLQISYTSPLTNNVSGTCKACVQTLIAFIVFGEPITFVKGLGIALCIGGSAWYSKVQYDEQQLKKQLAEQAMKQ